MDFILPFLLVYQSLWVILPISQLFKVLFNSEAYVVRISVSQTSKQLM